jgi:molybdopterin converting factor small subunit
VEKKASMVTITLMGQLETAEGERELACEVPDPVTIRALIQKQAKGIRHVFQLAREKKLMVTVNTKIASLDTIVKDGDAIRLVSHDGFGGTGLGPSF